MNDFLSTKKDFHKFCVEAYGKEYSQLITNWRDIDLKAQGTIGIGGIFLAAVFALTRDQLVTSLTFNQKTLLCVSISLSTLAVFLAAIVLIARDIDSPPSVDKIKTNMIDPVLYNADELNIDERNINFYNEICTLGWQNINSQLRSNIIKKAKILKIAQYIMLASIMTVTALSITRIFQL